MIIPDLKFNVINHELATIAIRVSKTRNLRHQIRNSYNNQNAYNSKNPNALSDGDEKGKGENNGSVGSLTDVNSRKDSVARNKFGETKKYPDF